MRDQDSVMVGMEITAQYMPDKHSISELKPQVGLEVLNRKKNIFIK